MKVWLLTDGEPFFFEDATTDIALVMIAFCMCFTMVLKQMKKMKEDFDNDLARARDVVAQKDAVVEDLKEQLKDMKTS